MLHAFKLVTGTDGASHVAEGTVISGVSTDAATIEFGESPRGPAFEWHVAPARQYVITLAGTFEFTTRDGETFVLRPGDVLVADDTSGTGHRWRLIDEQPWRRAYVVLRPGSADRFVPA